MWVVIGHPSIFELYMIVKFELTILNNYVLYLWSWDFGFHRLITGVWNRKLLKEYLKIFYLLLIHMFYFLKKLSIDWKLIWILQPTGLFNSMIIYLFIMRCSPLGHFTRFGAWQKMILDQLVFNLIMLASSTWSFQTTS